VEPLFVVAKIIGSPGKNDSLLFHSKLFLVWLLPLQYCCVLQHAKYFMTMGVGKEGKGRPCTSAVSRLWPAWQVPWTQLWEGHKKCLAKIKICDLQSLQSLVCAPYKHLLKSCITTLPLSDALSQACCTST